MLSELGSLVQCIVFVLQWFVGWLIDCPHVLVIILVSIGAIYFTYKLLKQFQTPTFLSSPKVSIMLMLVLISVMMRSYSINNQLMTLQTDLDTANWGLIQGSQYRIDILNMIDTATMDRKHREETEQREEIHTDNPLDGCLHVLVDLGPYPGLQIRQLYEPHSFTMSPTQSLYERQFGTPGDRTVQQLCSVSIQPPSSYLTTLVQSYSTCNTRILVLDHDTNVAQFITEIVANRILPDLVDNTTPVVVINIDMERVEQIVPAMLVTGALGHVDSVHLELGGDHTEGGDRVAQDITALAELTHSEDIEHKFTVEMIDNETYRSNYTDIPLMGC